MLKGRTQLNAHTNRCHNQIKLKTIPESTEIKHNTNTLRYWVSNLLGYMGMIKQHFVDKNQTGKFDKIMTMLVWIFDSHFKVSTVSHLT